MTTLSKLATNALHRAKPERSKQMKCKKCGKEFEQPWQMAQHARIEHPKHKRAAKVSQFGRAWLLEHHKEKIELCAKIGTGPALAQHPEWGKELFGTGSKRDQQYLYQTVSRVKKLQQNGGKDKAVRQRVWTAEQWDLVKEISNSGQYGSPERVLWKRAFRDHPEWKSILFSGKADNFYAFTQRIKKGMPRPGEEISTALVPVSQAPQVHNGQTPTLQILGREWTVNELEQVIRTVQNSLTPLKWCPDCGYPLGMHTKAFTIARNHRRDE